MFSFHFRVHFCVQGFPDLHITVSFIYFVLFKLSVLWNILVILLIYPVL
jgi:hypothetical protein